MQMMTPHREFHMGHAPHMPDFSYPASKSIHLGARWRIRRNIHISGMNSDPFERIDAPHLLQFFNIKQSTGYEEIPWPDARTDDMSWPLPA